MKDAISSKNIGRFGHVLVRPGRFDLILGVARFSLKGESFRLWAGLVHFQKGAVENDGVWYKNRLCLWYK